MTSLQRCHIGLVLDTTQIGLPFGETQFTSADTGGSWGSGGASAGSGRLGISLACVLMAWQPVIRSARIRVASVVRIGFQERQPG